MTSKMKFLQNFSNGILFLTTNLVNTIIYNYFTKTLKFVFCGTIVALGYLRKYNFKDEKSLKSFILSRILHFL